MTDINSVIVIGRITADVEAVQGGFGYISNGTAVAKISIAVNRSRKNGDEWIDEVSFFNITIWGKTAENLKPYLKKGQLIAVKGFLKQDRWKDQAGQNRSSVSIVAEQVELCGGRNQGGETDNKSGTVNAQTRIDPTFSTAAEQGGEFPEDIPF